MKAVGLDQPLFAARGEGAYLEDTEGRRYVDWVLSWGPLIFGHADPETVEAVVAAAREGAPFGTAAQGGGALGGGMAGAVPAVAVVPRGPAGPRAPRTA